MENTLITLNFNEVEPLAREYFNKYSELGEGAINHKVLIEESLQVLNNCRMTLKTEAVLIPLDKNAYEDGVIHMERSSFPCTALLQIAKHTVESVFAFLITLGECHSPNRNHAEQYYADLWAFSFFEASKEIIKNKIRMQENLDEKGFFITDAYGPGTYGMRIDKLEDMLEEVRNTMVGRLLDRDGNLPNQRLSGGFFLVTNEKSDIPPAECKDCQGHEKGCLICGALDVIPSRNLCMELLKSHGTPQNVIRHSEEVSRTAMTIGRALVEKGFNLDLRLLEAASLLHDIARVEENHGVKGAIALENKGYRQVAKLVKCHMFYATDPFKSAITELDILCLADRMVKEDKYVGLDARMGSVLDKLISKGIDTERVMTRLEENRMLKERIEDIIGKSINSLMEEQEIQ